MLIGFGQVFPAFPETPLGQSQRWRFHGKVDSRARLSGPIDVAFLQACLEGNEAAL